MKVICAPDSFKETLTAADAAQAMAAGIRDVDPSISADICPVGDGGEGTLDALLAAMNGTRHVARVFDPIGRLIDAAFGVTADGLGIVELARASGLALLEPSQRDPTRTTTYGTGQLIAAAAAAGCETTIVCIGGSATCDGGAGLAQALGVTFLDKAGSVITTPLTGGTLKRIARIEPAVERTTLRVACDVTNPLLGPDGAAAVYGPQKGATPEQVEHLDAALRHLASRTGIDPSFAGAGAAGGVGFGLVAFCGATLERGIDLVLDAIGFEKRCADADLVLTGEGRLDGQSMAGKAAIGVAKAAGRRGVSTIAIVGEAGADADRCMDSHDPPGPLHERISLVDRFGRERALRDAAASIRACAADAVRTWRKRQGY